MAANLCKCGKSRRFDTKEARSRGFAIQILQKKDSRLRCRKDFLTKGVFQKSALTLKHFLEIFKIRSKRLSSSGNDSSNENVTPLIYECQGPSRENHCFLHPYVFSGWRIFDFSQFK